jgi:hypothetical protein
MTIGVRTCAQAKDLCRVLSEAGESYAPLIVAQLGDAETLAAWPMLVEALAQCVGSGDTEVAMQTFQFWIDLAERFTHMHDMEAQARCVLERVPVLE